MQVHSLQDALGRVLYIHKDTEWPIGFMMVFAELFQAQARQHEHTMHTRRQAGAHIGHAVANKDSIVEINAQFVPRPQ